MSTHLQTIQEELSTPPQSPKRKAIDNIERVPKSPVSVFGIKQELKTQSPINSPLRKRELPTTKPTTLEIVSDSSNDAFTYMCTHPQQMVGSTPTVTKRESEAPSKPSKKRSKSKTSDDFLCKPSYLH